MAGIMDHTANSFFSIQTLNLYVIKNLTLFFFEMAASSVKVKGPSKQTKNLFHKF